MGKMRREEWPGGLEWGPGGICLLAVVHASGLTHRWDRPRVRAESWIQWAQLRGDKLKCQEVR